jgi:hypothetical protein
LKLHIADLTLDTVGVVTKKGIIVAKMPSGSLPFFQSWTAKVFAARDNDRATAKLVKYARLIPDGEPFSSARKKEVNVLPQFIEPRIGHIALRTV